MKILILLWIAGILVTMISGCASTYMVTTRDCIIFQHVPMKKPVRQWFKEARPKATPEVIEFLDDVANNNDRLTSKCSNG